MSPTHKKQVNLLNGIGYGRSLNASQKYEKLRHKIGPPEVAIKTLEIDPLGVQFSQSVQLAAARCNTHANAWETGKVG